MPDFLYFVRLYATDLTGVSCKIISDPVRVEFFEGPRSYEMFIRVCPPVFRLGKDNTIASIKTLQLAGDQFFIEFKARTEDFDAKRQFCEDQIDRVVAQLSVMLSPALFSFRLWEGWISDGKQLPSDFWLRGEYEIKFEPEDLKKDMASFTKVLSADQDLNTRFTLMSKMFSRAQGIEPGEERFLWLWTVLEVFPMKGTSDIKPISEYLSKIVGIAQRDVKAKLGIGLLANARADLVHDGKLPYTREELAVIAMKLEHIDITVLRSLGGLPYAGHLDKYLS